MEENKETFEEWQSGFNGLDFEHSAERMKDKILESPELDKESREYFIDSFKYVMSVYKAGKPLDTNLMKIHMTQLKTHDNLSIEQFGRVLILLSLCGFSFDFTGKN